MDIKVVKVETAEDQSRMEEFLHDFFRQMPLGQAFGLLPKPPSRTPSPFKPTQSDGDFSFIALDAHGNIVGVAFNIVNVCFDTEPDAQPELVRMMKLLKWIEKDAKLDTLPERTIELRVLSVHKDWRHRGVARALAEESMKQARESGFKAMRVCCASEFTAKLARSLGWREHYRIHYSDFSKSGMDFNIMPEHPHEYVYYYATDL